MCVCHLFINKENSALCHERKLQIAAVDPLADHRCCPRPVVPTKSQHAVISTDNPNLVSTDSASS